MEARIETTEFGNYLRVKLSAGEEFYVERGAVGMIRGPVDLSPELLGGITASLLRGFGGGEGFLLNHLKAKGEAEVLVFPDAPGIIREFQISGEELILQDGVYLAHAGDVELSAKFGGLQSLLTGAGLFFLKASGNGQLYLCASGAIVEVNLQQGEEIVVDNTNFLAMDSSMEMKVEFVGKGLLGKLFSGEGVMFRIMGPGRVLLQTNSLKTLIRRMMFKG